MVDALLHSEGESSLKNILQTGIDKGLKFYGMDKDNYYEMAHFTRLFHLDELQQIEERDMRRGGFDDCKGVTNMLSSGIAPKHNSLLLFSLEFAKLTLTYIVGVVDFGMGQEIQMVIPVVV